MKEIKIRFKSGNIGYFKLIEDSECNIEDILIALKKVIDRTHIGYVTLIDLVDNKETMINLREIASLGYSNIESKGNV